MTGSAGNELVRFVLRGEAGWDGGYSVDFCAGDGEEIGVG
jgi:hypothetical protein